MMKVWVITQDDPGYDDYAGFCVAAETEEEARKLCVEADHIAQKDEEWDLEGPERWLNPAFATCVEVDLTTPQIVMTDFYNA